MTATYAFTVHGATYAEVMQQARKAADLYWGRTPYVIESVDRSSYGASVETRMLGVAG